MDDNFETQGLNISNYRTHVSWWLPWSFFAWCLPISSVLFVSVVLVHQLLVLFPLPTLYSLVRFKEPKHGHFWWWILSCCGWIPICHHVESPPGFIARVIPIYRWSPPPLCWPSIHRCQPLQGLHHSTESRERSACKTSVTGIFLLNLIGWCMSSMIMTIMCVFIWLVEGWAIFHSIMIMCLYITYIYIYIFFIQIYIFSLWMLMGLFEGWSYSSAGMMGRKKHDTITIKRFFRIRFHFWMNST